ncbi:MAG: SRPBCC domain-containing protein [Anaerolineae bacterium]|nr:SRPBCC domain-containing protein [Anaerolineae bacterium]
MPDKTQTLEFVISIDSSPAQVYDALTNPVVVPMWIGDVVESDPKKEGRFYIWWRTGYYTAGHYIHLEEDSKLVFSWHGLEEPHPTQVTISMTGDEQQSSLTLTHSQIGVGEPWEKIVATFNQEWPAALDNLKSVVETGIDRRLYDMPMSGILVSRLVTPELAEKHTFPVDFGIQLSGVAQGMAAEAAGLQKDDILVRIGASELRSFEDYNAAMRAHKPGDTLPVEYARGQQIENTQIELSARPIPELPATALEFAAELRQLYAQYSRQLEAIFAGVSQEQASYRPGHKEWSAKETLAHLLLTERWVHFVILTALAGKPRAKFGENDLNLLTALAGAYPTISDLLTEFQRAQDITIAAVEGIPAGFMRSKPRSHMLSHLLLKELLYHSKDHFDQIEAAILAASE